MGGNLASWAGSPGATLAAAALCLESLGRVVRRSSLYSTEPVGFTDQPRFVNAVIALETELEPRELLEALLAIEQEFGRSRTAGLANRPRTLDLDILLFGDLEISEPDLNIPHPRLAERAFVLIPLNEIAPQILIPGYGESVAQLMASLALKVKPGASELLEGSKTRREAVVRIESDAWGPR
jgi:2-amino-4-hydroxy-6-hydroxymethyldihydropteridine diphosphokinase